MGPGEKPIDETRTREGRRRLLTSPACWGTEDAGGTSRRSAIYPLITLVQTLAAAALLVAAVVVGGSTPNEGAAIVEAATRLALAIVFVAVYVPATATLLQWYAERREARRLLAEARRDVDAILRTRRR